MLQNDVKCEMSVMETLGKKNRLSENVNLCKLYKQETTEATLLALSVPHISHTP